MSENIWKTSCFNPIQRKSKNTASHAGMWDIQWEQADLETIYVDFQPRYPMLLLLLVVLQCCSVGGAAVAQCCSVGSVGVGCTLVGGQFAATGLWTGCRGSNELSSVSSKIWADGRDLSDPMDTAAGLATANDRKKMVMITTIEVREQIFSEL